MQRDWEAWVMGEGLLEDGQVWENDTDVIQLERRGNSYMAVIFKKNPQGLTYNIAAVYDRDDKLLEFLDKMQMIPTSKIITLTRNQTKDLEGE